MPSQAMIDHIQSVRIQRIEQESGRLADADMQAVTRAVAVYRERVAAVDELCHRFGLDALIRLHADDFALLSTIGRVFAHFNLEVTLNEVGRRYALLPILKPGQRRPDGREVLPIVDPTRLRYGLCTQVLQRVPVGQITSTHFAYSLPTIRTVEQLQAALIKRYAHMFPDLSHEAIIARGCAVTRLALEESSWRRQPLQLFSAVSEAVSVDLPVIAFNRIPTVPSRDWGSDEKHREPRKRRDAD
jgi:hypothetical protein